MLCWYTADLCFGLSASSRVDMTFGVASAPLFFLSLFFKVYLKTKKMTDISQTQSGCKAKSLGIPCGFQGSLTQNPAAFVEIEDSFAFSDTP